MLSTLDEFDESFDKYKKKKKVDLSYEEYDPKEDTVKVANSSTEKNENDYDESVDEIEIEDLLVEDFLDEDVKAVKEPEKPVRTTTPKKKTSEKVKPATSKKKPQKKKAQPKKKEKRGFATVIRDFFANAGLGEYLVIFTSIVILVVGGIIFSMYSDNKEVEAGVESLIPIGEQLGEVAVHTDVFVQNIVSSFVGGEEANKVLERMDESVEISATFSSIMQDLKVKFVNKETDELITGIPFKVEIIPPSGEDNMFVVTDEDKDGMIYVRDLEAGIYQVVCKSIGDVKFTSTPIDVAVKDEIEYQEINIINEAKTEAEINVEEEDTAEDDIEVESKLQDTVAWVASSKTPVGDGAGYVEVDKSTITDPSKVSMLSTAFFKVSASTEPTATATPTPTPTPTPSATPTPTPSATPTPTPSATPTPTPSATPTPTPKTYTVSVPTIVEGDTDKWIGVTISADENAALVGETVSYSWVVDGKSAGTDSIASLPDEKMKTAGTTITAVCTITCESDPSLSGTATATIVVKQGLNVTLDKTEATIARPNTLQLTATVSNEVADDSVTWKSSDTEIATVDTNGKVTPVGGGTATITCTTKEKKASDGTAATATCKVTVSPLTITIVSSTTGAKSPETIYLDTQVNLTATFKNRLEDDSITWKTSDATIGTITKKTESAEKHVYTFKAIKEGTVDITVYSTAGLGENKGQPVAVYRFVVESDPKKDTTTKLQDNAGTQIYIKDGTEYREATYADYYSAEKFYVKGAVEYTYTGWQTLADNNTYFFDRDGNKVTGTQVIQGVEYTFSPSGILSMGDGVVGIDVSKWNGKIDWTAVKKSGVDFVIIRCGYRGSSTGALVVDPRFEENIAGATAAGLKVGVYFFTQAVNEVEAVEEASLALALTSKYSLAYPIFIDVEGSGGRADGLDKATRTSVVKAFCQTIANSGKRAGIYANKTWLNSKLNMGSLNAYTIWLAQYNTSPTYTGKYDMWQYSDQGHVGGISGNVDMNKSYVKY